MSNVKSNDRMPKIPDADMTEAQKKIFAEISAGPRGVARGPWHAFMRSPGLMEQAQKFGEYVRFQSPVERRILEMTALMVARDWTQQYEWAAHYSAAVKAGLAAAVADAIAAGRRPARMAEDEAVLHEFLHELLTNKSVSDDTYAAAAAKFGEAGVIEILGVVSYFTMLAMVMNVARTPVVEHAAPPTPLLPLPLQP
jgi:4-carboxymuconolactone decarboxylase